MTPAAYHHSCESFKDCCYSSVRCPPHPYMDAIAREERETQTLPWPSSRSHPLNLVEFLKNPQGEIPRLGKSILLSKTDPRPAAEGHKRPVRLSPLPSF